MADNDLLRRYNPFQRFTSGDGFHLQGFVSVKADVYGDSVTDKESYRLSLNSSRGSDIGSAVSGQYMYPDGKYASHLDLSFVMRPDLTIQELDRYLDAMKLQRERADDELKSQIDSAIEKLDNIRLDQLSKQSQSEEVSE